MSVRDAVLDVVNDMRRETGLDVPYSLDVRVSRVAEKLDQDLQSEAFSALLLDALQSGEVRVGGAQITGKSRSWVRSNIVRLPDGRMVFTVGLRRGGQAPRH